MASKLFTTLAAATTLAGIVTTADAANAGTFTQSVDYKPSDPNTTILAGGYVATDINDTISFDKFNTKLGKLKSIKIDLSSSLIGDAEFENKSNTAAPVTVNLAGLLQLQLPAGVDRFRITPKHSYTYDLARFDGTVDYAGASGRTVEGLTASLNDTQTFTDQDFFQYFLGKGKVDFTFLATSQSNVSGPGNLRSSIGTYAKAGVTVSYNYDAKSVPEPSALLGVGLIAGFGLMSKTKKSWLKTSNSNV